MDASEKYIREYFYQNLKDIAQGILSSRSVFLSNYTSIKPSFLIQNLIRNYVIRKDIFGKKFDDYVFINLDYLADDNFRDLESELITNFIINSGSKLSFGSYQDLYESLVDTEKTLIIHSDSTDKNFQRTLYSYKFFLGSRILFIFNQDPIQTQIFSDEFLKTEISGNILETIVITRLEELQIDEEIEPQILQELNGDLETLDELIIRTLYLNKNRYSMSREIEQNIVPIREEIQKFELKENLNQEIIEPKNGENTAPVVVFDTKTPEITKPIKQELRTKDLMTRSDGRDLEIKKASAVKTKAKKSKVKNTSSNTKKQLPSDLTDRERDIFEKLLDKKFLSREEFAKVIWKKDWKEKSNDNAIDKTISRLRSKFVKAGYDKSYITSKKGEGVKIGE